MREARVRVALGASLTCTWYSSCVSVRERSGSSDMHQMLGTFHPFHSTCPSEYPLTTPRVPAIGILAHLPRVTQTPPPPLPWQHDRCHSMRATEMTTAGVVTEKISRSVPVAYTPKSSDVVSARTAVRMRMCTDSHGSTMVGG